MYTSKEAGHPCRDTKLRECKDRCTCSNHRSMSCWDSFPCCSTNPMPMVLQWPLHNHLKESSPIIALFMYTSILYIMREQASSIKTTCMNIYYHNRSTPISKVNIYSIDFSPTHMRFCFQHAQGKQQLPSAL
jgi:hypothetical protein